MLYNYIIIITIKEVEINISVAEDSNHIVLFSLCRAHHAALTFKFCLLQSENTEIKDAIQ